MGLEGRRFLVKLQEYSGLRIKYEGGPEYSGALWFIEGREFYS